MKKLILLEDSNIIGEIQMDEGQEYTIGRNTDSHIVLSPSKGISRKHFRIYFEDSIINVEALSQFAKFSGPYDGQSTIEITQNCEVSCSPFILKFEGFEE